MSNPTDPASPAGELPKNYDFTQVEPRWNEEWERSGIYRYDPDSAAAKAGRVYSVDTPPPYVSAAHLHVGHAMSYSQAEFVVRYKRMRGYEVFYPMGFDDNGLPTERYVEQKYKVDKKRITRKEFIELCLKETRSGAAVYEQLWRSLGLSVDWRMTYSTIQPRAVEHAQRSFLELAAGGHVERRSDPILWCPRCGTSLSQADVEADEERERPLHRLRFARSDGGEDGVIDTTRPELVTACVAIACNPEDPRFAALAADTRFAVPLTELRADGSSAEPRTVPVVRDESVDPAFGTGLMMVCTFGDTEDIAKWREHNLETCLVIDADGHMATPDLVELHGKRVHVQAKGSKVYSEARLAAKELLEAHGYLIGVSANQSRAAVHERCGTPLEFQVTPQWFIRVLDHRDAFLARGRQLAWHPEFMRERYESWVEGLKWDWNISRQRFYGVPFPVWYCNACDGTVLPPIEALPLDPTGDPCPVAACPACGGGDFRPENDVMDTWMTSSLTPLINANWTRWQDRKTTGELATEARPEIYPQGVRVQAFEIIRTWLFYTVVKGHFHTDNIPWRDVMISGWGLDRHGKKMSKRLGNFVDPQQVIERYSADALRYWSAGATLGHDLRYLEEDVKGGKRLLTKLWNSTRFAMQGVGEGPLGAVAEEPTVADRWARSHLVATVDAATAGFQQYEYNKALRATEQVFWKVWCDNYLELVKGRFWNPEDYTPGQVEAARRTIFEGTYALLRLFAPVLPFITEELYQLAIRPRLGDDAPTSVHIAPWPQDEAGAIDVFGGARDVDSEAAGDLLIGLLTAVRTLKSQARIGLGRPLAEVVVVGDRSQADFAPLIVDWQAASRAALVRFEPASSRAAIEATVEGGLIDVEGSGVAIGIVPMSE